MYHVPAACAPLLAEIKLRRSLYSSTSLSENIILPDPSFTIVKASEVPGIVALLHQC
jgi:hypothetical protein